MQGTITWIKYDMTNPPPLGKFYLVTDGIAHVEIASIDIAPFNGCSKREERPIVCYLQRDSDIVLVTHYAYINLPPFEEEEIDECN